MGISVLNEYKLGRSYGVIMSALAIGGRVWILLSVLHIWSVRSALGVSLLAVVLSYAATVGWLTYACLVRDLVVLLSALVGLVLTAVLVYTVLYFTPGPTYTRKSDGTDTYKTLSKASSTQAAAAFAF